MEQGNATSGIAGAIASVVGSISNIFVANKQEDIAYQQWLNLAVPGLQEFYHYEEKEDNSFMIIAILGLVLIVVVIAVVWIRK